MHSQLFKDLINEWEGKMIFLNLWRSFFNDGRATLSGNYFDRTYPFSI